MTVGELADAAESQPIILDGFIIEYRGEIDFP